MAQSNNIQRQFTANKQGVTNKSISINKVAEQFCADKRKNTREVYRALMNHLEKFAGHIPSLNEITDDFIRDFVKFLLEKRKLQPGSVRTYMQNFHAILSECTLRKMIKSNPMPPLKKLLPPPSESRKFSLSVEEVQRLMRTECRSLQISLAFILSLFTGLRLSDIKDLRWSHFSSLNDVWILKKRQVKTGNYVTVPVQDWLYKALKRLPANENGFVFTLPSSPTVSKYLNLWCEDAGITKHVTFHIARHTFVSTLTNSHVELLTASTLSGHTKIETTQRYAHLSNSTLVEPIKTLGKTYLFGMEIKENWVLNKEGNTQDNGLKQRRKHHSFKNFAKQCWKALRKFDFVNLKRLFTFATEI